MTCKHCSHDEASLSYLAQYDIFEDTLLGERPGFGTLRQEGVVLMTSDVWRRVAGVPVDIVPIRSHELAGQATGGHTVRLAQDAERCVVPHEFAHIIHQRLWGTPLGDVGHGPEWRSSFVLLTELMYGSHYAELLAGSFRDHGLDGRYTVMHNGDRPLVDIDRIAGPVRGGWRP